MLFCTVHCDNYVILTKKAILNCFNLILLVFYMFRTSYVHNQKDYIVHAALYSMFCFPCIYTSGSAG